MRVLGSYLSLQEPSQPQSLYNPHLIMAVGNGEMWVVDAGKNIDPGDYLISSDVTGHAMKDDEGRFPVGHIVARAAEKVDWNMVSETVNGQRHKKISVLYGNFVRSDVTSLTRELGELKATVKLLVSEKEKATSASLGEVR